MRIKLTSVVFSSCLLMSVAPYAAEVVSKPRYRLVEGKGYTVCEAFLKNLNAFPLDEPPMVCEQKIHPSHPEFTRPVWTELNVQSNLKSIYEAESQVFTRTGVKPKPFDEWVPKFHERVKRGELKPRLGKLVVDLSNGGPVTLVRYDPTPSPCQRDWETIRTISDTNSPGAYILVQRENPQRLETFGGLIGARGRLDVLMYRNKVPYFIDVYATPKLTDWTVEVEIGLTPVAKDRTPEDQYILARGCMIRANVEKRPSDPSTQIKEGK